MDERMTLCDTGDGVMPSISRHVREYGILVGLVSVALTATAQSPISPGYQAAYLYMGNSAIEQKKIMHAIELFGTKVAPVVREEIARRNAAAS